MKKNIFCLSAIVYLLSIGLIFSNNIWFDESYTLALVKHDFSDMIHILKSDMHPPLYFISLKLWVSCFGFSMVQTKIFSTLGLLSTLLLGCTLIRKDFGEKAACYYTLFVAATPMVYYFSVQQRCYSWCVFWVTLCFVMGMRMMHKATLCNCILFAAAFLFSGYNHTYALIAVAGIAGFVNLNYFFKKKKGIRNIILTDFLVLAGYAPWMVALISQTRSAVSGFWLTSLETLSVVVFFISVVVFAAVLWKKENRKLPIMAGVFSIMFVQVLGFGTSLLIRPLYIARYAAPLIGIFALVLALCFERKVMSKKIVVSIGFIIILQYIGIFCFEYSPSISEFRNEFEKESEVDDIFVYSDSAFGMMSYYYPKNPHICFCYESWFEAWENVQFADKDSFIEEKNGSKLWYVVNEKSYIPDWMKKKWNMVLKYSFRNDFNCFDVYLLNGTTIH